MEDSMKVVVVVGILVLSFLVSNPVSILFGEDGNKKATIEILNPEYTKPPNETDNIEIAPESTADDLMRKVNYCYATRDFDKAIELCQSALKKTSDPILIARLNFSLSSHYLEKGIQPYLDNKDDRFYQLSIQHAKKSLEDLPDNWKALGNLGAVSMNMGNFEQAVFYFSEAKKHLNKDDPSYSDIEFHRALAEKMSKKK